MIDLTAFKPSRHDAAPVGALFISFTEDGGHFLSGCLSTNVAVLVELDDETSWQMAEMRDWDLPPGIVIEGGRIQVEVKSGVSVENFHELPPGSILMASSGPALVAKDRRKENRAVQLSQPEDPPKASVPSVAFTRWQYVTGEGDALIVHYISSGKGADSQISAG